MALSSSNNLGDRDGGRGANDTDEEEALLRDSDATDTAKSAVPRSSKAVRIATAVCFYLTVSLSMVFLNKQVLSKSDELKSAPLFFTWTQVLVSVFGCWLFGVLGKTMKMLSIFPPFEYKVETAVTVAPVTIAFCGMLVFNNLCLKYVEVSFYQVARSLTIPFNIVLSGLLFSNWPSIEVIGTCGIIVAGYLCGVTGEIHFDRYGVFYGVCSSMFVAGYSIMVKRALKSVGNSMERLMIYTNLNTALMLPILFWWSGELDTLKFEYFGLLNVWQQIIGVGCCGFLIGFATFMQIKETSPLTHNVSGTFKACLQTILAVIWFRNPVSWLAATGFVLVVGGSYAYSTVKRSEMTKKDAEQKRAQSLDELEMMKLSPPTNDIEQGAADNVSHKRLST